MIYKKTSQKPIAASRLFIEIFFFFFLNVSQRLSLSVPRQLVGKKKKKSDSQNLLTAALNDEHRNKKRHSFKKPSVHRKCIGVEPETSIAGACLLL